MTPKNKKYLEDLTDHLINCHKLYAIPKHNFVGIVQAMLFAGPLTDNNMSPERLGKIMCAAEECYLIVDREELLANLAFGGNGSILLRDLVSRTLAFIIEDRLREEPKSLLAPYRRTSKHVIPENIRSAVSRW
jgi:hypothetical protein